MFYLVHLQFEVVHLNENVRRTSATDVKTLV